MLPDTKSSTGFFVSLSGVGGGRLRAPLYRVDFGCDLMTGYGCLVAALDELPIDGVHMLLGNDLAGSRVVPSCDLICDLNSELLPFPACAVTHSVSQLVWTDPPIDAESSLSAGKLSDVVLTKSSLIADQQDAELKPLLHEALTEEESKTSPICNYRDADGPLVRKWSDPILPAEERSEIRHFHRPKIQKKTFSFGHPSH